MHANSCRSRALRFTPPDPRQPSGQPGCGTASPGAAAALAASPAGREFAPWLHLSISIRIVKVTLAALLPAPVKSRAPGSAGPGAAPTPGHGTARGAAPGGRPSPAVPGHRRAPGSQTPLCPCCRAGRACTEPRDRRDQRSSIKRCQQQRSSPGQRLTELTGSRRLRTPRRWAAPSAEPLPRPEQPAKAARGKGKSCCQHSAQGQAEVVAPAGKRFSPGTGDAAPPLCPAPITAPIQAAQGPAYAPYTTQGF